MSTSQAETGGKIGRPAKDAKDRRSAVVRLGIRESLREQLDAASQANGRTSGEEAEHRLSESFRLEPVLRVVSDKTPAGSFLLNLSNLIETVQSHQNPPGVELGDQNWPNSPLTRAAICSAMAVFLDYYSPEPPEPSDTALKPREQAMYGAALQYMREFGAEYAKLLTGQLPELEEALDRGSNAEH